MQILIKFSLLLILVAALLAPFTFMKEANLASLKDNSTELIQADIDAKNRLSSQKKAPAKPVEKPLHDVILPDFAEMTDISAKKKRFFDFIRPTIIKQNNEILTTRSSLEYYLAQITLEIGLTPAEEQDLYALVKRYKVNKHNSTLQQIEALLSRVDVIPVSLVLVQAANESAWGTSRFARIGLNFFGIWCYQPKCGMVPSGRNEGAKHEVAAFNSVEAAVKGYFNNINTHNAYYIFRTIRAELRAHNQPLSANILATGLLPYSERGADYVGDITDMLRHNQRYFTYDSQQGELAD
jgi:Bax protein